MFFIYWEAEGHVRTLFDIMEDLCTTQKLVQRVRTVLFRCVTAGAAVCVSLFIDLIIIVLIPVIGIQSKLNIGSHRTNLWNVRFFMPAH